MRATKFRWCLLLGVLLGAHARVGHAQYAPTGTHYAGRASDTGHTAPGASGAYAASVPIEFPAARGGVPIPFSITYGGRGVGAAGFNWNLSVSFVRRDLSWAYRRPDRAFSGREQIVLSLGGESIPFTKGSATSWFARRDATTLELRQYNDQWTLLDGNGNEYAFSNQGFEGGSDLWLLTSITSKASGNLVEFLYQLYPVPVATQTTGGTAGTEIDLVTVRYNSHPVTTGCFKNEIQLTYGAPAATPLAVSYLGSRLLARSRIIDSVQVLARDTCGNTAKQVRKYAFKYAKNEDLDIENSRLANVVVYGLSGTPEETTGILAAGYSYASATSRSPEKTLTYARGTDIAFPADLTGSSSGISLSNYYAGETSPVSGITTVSYENLVDFTGDGRPDLIFKKGGQLSIALNRPVGSAASTFTTTPSSQLSTAGYLDRPLASSSMKAHRYQYSDVNNENVWRQMIDMNGDGRIDMVDASETAGSWVIYINTASAATSTNPVTWVRTSISVAHLKTMLIASGHSFENGFIPLARRTTGYDIARDHCWRWDSTQLKYVDYPAGFSDPYQCGAATPAQRSNGEKTFTEWELRDYNGDGYPDFAFDSAPVQTIVPVFNPTNQPAYVKDRSIDQLIAGADLNVAYNSSGLRFGNGDQFGPPSVFEAGAGCGVALWSNFETSTSDQQHEVCGSLDFNGDGLVDRLTSSTQVRLSDGMHVNNFSPRFILPGLVRQANDERHLCAQQPLYTARATSGIRDLTGDGVPDYIDSDIYGAWRVYIGTGSGYAPSPAIVSGVAFSLSVTSEDCGNVDFSRTISGLYDIDADGMPDVVYYSASSPHLEVYHLSGNRLGRPESGRLIAIDNGAGALTEISYRSAKQDSSTEHQVPGSEVVVSATATTGMRGFGGTTTQIRYAYGSISQFFDNSVDSFVTRGYRRSVEVTGSVKAGLESQFATIRDYYALPPFDSVTHSTVAARLQRYELAGRLRDTTVLGAGVPFDPMVLLTTDAPSDPRRVTGQHEEWAGKFVPLTNYIVPDVLDCADVMYPYDWQLSAASNIGAGRDFCTARGFSYPTLEESWRGAGNNAGTRSSVTDVDDNGNVLLARNDNDRFRSDDDVCIENTYASPTAGRLYRSLYKRLTSDCNIDRKRVFASDVWEYDALPVGQVYLGRMTAHSVERRNTSSGSLIGTGAIREFQASYDSVGNVSYIVTARADGTLRSLTTTYDEFGLVSTSSTLRTAGTPDMVVQTVPRALDLATIASKDANGTNWGWERDGFARISAETIQVPNGPALIVSTTAFSNFSYGSTGMRSVSHATFPNPATSAAAGTSERTTETAFLDELGRVREAHSSLGSDYVGDLVQKNSYDALGRLMFSSDTTPSASSSANDYGTTYQFESDGTLKCSVRGYGVQPLVSATNLNTETLPTCVTHSIVNNQLVAAISSADSMQSNTPQSGVTTIETRTAIGRLLSTQSTKAGITLELARYASDWLGQTTSITRFRDPVSGAAPSSWSWRFDSLGQVLTFSEPEAVTRYFDYSDWGEVLTASYNDTAVTPAQSIRLERTYDGLGRLKSSAEKRNGVAVPNTKYGFFYDVDQGSPSLTSARALGRLTRTTSSVGDMYVSYDALGNAEAKAYVDPNGTAYKTASSYRSDGGLNWLEYSLPDTGYKPERYTYTYDSASRLRTVAAVDRRLFSATGIDSLGRLREAAFGQNIGLKAVYAETGRRLPISTTVRLTAGPSRTTQYSSFDAVGRELERREDNNDVAGATTKNTYDALGRLVTGVVTRPGKFGSTLTTSNGAFSYDPAGNILALKELASPTSQVSLTYSSIDIDRLCRVDYGATQTGPCNVMHDGSGNVIKYASNTGANRTLTYYGSGLVSTVTNGITSASFRYDGSGEISEVDSSGIYDPRADRYYGPFTRKSATVNGSDQSILIRNVPGPGGILASQRGAGGPWIYPFGETRGLRYSTDDGTAFVQEVSYASYGTATSTGAQSGNPAHTSSQWNGGDALSDLGLVHIGARVYDPVIGRFLSRDPLVVPRSAAAMNPYAFAANDPVNNSDPSGLDVTSTIDGGPTTIVQTGLFGGIGAFAAAVRYALGRNNVSSASGGPRAAPPHVLAILATGAGFSGLQQMYRSADAQDEYDGSPDSVAISSAFAGFGDGASKDISATARAYSGYGDYVQPGHRAYITMHHAGAWTREIIDAYIIDKVRGYAGNIFQNRINGMAAETDYASRWAGSEIRGQAYFSGKVTGGRARFLDLIIDHENGYEIKVGFTSGPRAMAQARKDVAILRGGRAGLKAIKWIFYPSPENGGFGPDVELRDFLTYNGIGIEYTGIGE